MDLDVLMFQQNNDLNPGKSFMTNSNSVTSNITTCLKPPQLWNKYESNNKFLFLGLSVSKNKASV